MTTATGVDDTAEDRGPSRLRERTVPFTSGDGRPANLVNVRGEREPTRGPVLLVHGAGVRANIFRAPTRQTLVDALVDQGYDVWLENWRASIDLPPTSWTLDQAAVHDHPSAVRTVVAETGSDDVQAVVHCQGSTSFVMSAVAGLVPEVSTVVTNAVSLHPVVSDKARLKSRWIRPLIAPLTRYLNPQWGRRAPGLVPKALNALVHMTHHECEEPVCKWSSFTYGVGFPVLWRHENLNDATHRWLAEEFAAVPMSFFAQMDRCIEAGHLVSVDGRPELPESFVAGPPQTDARFVFLTGEQNQCFLPASQQQTYEWFEGHQPGRHRLVRFPDYGHLDVFMGQEAAQDTTPVIVEALGQRSERRRGGNGKRTP